jgi:hypothetical protein
MAGGCVAGACPIGILQEASSRETRMKTENKVLKRIDGILSFRFDGVQWNERFYYKESWLHINTSKVIPHESPSPISTYLLRLQKIFL